MKNLFICKPDFNSIFELVEIDCEEGDFDYSRYISFCGKAIISNQREVDSEYSYSAKCLISLNDYLEITSEY